MDRIRDEGARLLAEPNYRVAAERMAEEIAAMPGPDEVARIIDDRCGP
ncbi:MAG: hypothetical protein ACRD0S_02915 [Acidimicrobiales bacterium]